MHVRTPEGGVTTIEVKHDHIGWPCPPVRDGEPHNCEQARLDLLKRKRKGKKTK